MDFDMDSDGDYDGDDDSDSDDDSDDTDYEYDDESGDLEMDFETEVEESADFDVERDPDQDIEYDLSDQSVESTSTLWHADSNEQENWYYVETDQDDQPEDDKSTESDQDDQPEGDPEYIYDSPTSEAGVYDDGKSAITFHTFNDDEHGSQRHSRFMNDFGAGQHNKDERKRNWHNDPEYQDPGYEGEEDDEEYEEEYEDTPWDRIRRMARSILTITPMEDDDA